MVILITNKAHENISWMLVRDRFSKTSLCLSHFLLVTSWRWQALDFDFVFQVCTRKSLVFFVVSVQFHTCITNLVFVEWCRSSLYNIVFKHMQKCQFKSFHRNLPTGDITINCIVISFKVLWKLYPVTCTNLKVKKYFLFYSASTLLLSKYIVDRQKQALFTISKNRCIT